MIRQILGVVSQFEKAMLVVEAARRARAQARDRRQGRGPQVATPRSARRSSRWRVSCTASGCPIARSPPSCSRAATAPSAASRSRPRRSRTCWRAEWHRCPGRCRPMRTKPRRARLALMAIPLDTRASVIARCRCRVVQGIGYCRSHSRCEPAAAQYFIAKQGRSACFNVSHAASASSLSTKPAKRAR